MRIVVTGGAGFIGSHVVGLLVERGHAVLVLDDLSAGDLENLAGCREHIAFEPLDVRNLAAIAKAVRDWRAEAAVHLAAVASVVRSITETEYTYAVNLDGTFNVLEAARRAGVRRLVFASSAAVYGLEPELPSRETDLPAPASPYAAHKAAGELLLRAYRSAWGMETVALRFFNVFGERQRADSPYSGVISIFAAALAARGQAVITGNGLQTRDFVYVGDVAAAVAAAALNPDPGLGPFNVARGEALSIRTLYTILAQLQHVADDPAYGPARPGDVLHSRASIHALRETLGVTPATPVAEGLARLVRWYAASTLL